MYIPDPSKSLRIYSIGSSSKSSSSDSVILFYIYYLININKYK